MNCDSYIPEKDSDYIPYGHFSDICKIVDSKKFLPVYIAGETSNGKTSMVLQAHAKFKRPIIRVNLTALVDEESIIGRQTLVNGSVVIVEGPLLLAMRHGFSILFDEISAAHPNAIMCIQSILEGNPYYFRYTDEVIHPAHGFNIYATDNTKGQGSPSGKYIGTNVLNESFLERFPITIEQDYPDNKVEMAIIKSAMTSCGCYEQEVADKLLKWSSSIRLTYKSGALSTLITTRRLRHIIETYSLFRDMKKTIRFCVSRFDSVTRDAFIDLWAKLGKEENLDAQQ